MKKELVIGIILGIILCFVIFMIPYLPKQQKSFHIKDKEIVLLKNNEMDIEKYSVERNIILSDCSEYIIDYNSITRNIIYLNSNNEIVEKNIETGKIQIQDLSVFKKSNEENIHNLQYGPGDDELSFTFKEYLYTYNINTDKVKKIEECMSSYWCNTYQWLNSNEFFAVSDNTGRSWEFNKWNIFTKEIEEIENAIRSFTVSNDGKYIGMIKMYHVNYDSVVEVKYQLLVFNSVDNSIKDLGVFKSNNFVLKIVDNNLFYIEEKNNKKNSILYCIDLISGKKKCLYKTNNKIIGIIYNQ